MKPEANLNMATYANEVLAQHAAIPAAVQRAAAEADARGANDGPAPAPAAPNSLAAVDALLAGVGIDAPLDDVLSVIDRAEAFERAIAEWKKRRDAWLFAQVQARGDITLGTCRWYIGPTKKVKCRDKAKTLQAVMEAAGGDEGRLVEAFASEPFKQGNLKTLLAPDVWEQCFETTYDDELQEGKPARVKKVDSKFLR